LLPVLVLLLLLGVLFLLLALVLLLLFGVLFLLLALILLLFTLVLLLLFRLSLLLLFRGLSFLSLSLLAAVRGSKCSQKKEQNSRTDKSNWLHKRFLLYRNFVHPLARHAGRG
jgi:hypothetical protein